MRSSRFYRSEGLIKQIADMKAEIQEMKTKILELSTVNNKK
ncbi:unnamed protein product [marine sediment metagenome]|uniref:Uncharacterized protein n=1 Tax=marine sediment metagenome TaxID=412755 RepID=X1KJL2_9ZZZZ